LLCGGQLVGGFGALESFEVLFFFIPAKIQTQKKAKTKHSEANRPPTLASSLSPVHFHSHKNVQAPSVVGKEKYLVQKVSNFFLVVDFFSSRKIASSIGRTFFRLSGYQQSHLSTSGSSFSRKWFVAKIP
jgi:hypothetical protein